MKHILTLIFLCFFNLSNSQIIYKEDFGTGNGWVDQGYTGFLNKTVFYGGHSDVETSKQSSGYTGASGNSNLNVHNEFIVGGINTANVVGAYLLFGIHTAKISDTLIMEWSTDSVNWTNINFTPCSAVMTWQQDTIRGLPLVSNLRFRWRSTPYAISKNLSNYKIDDLTIGVSSVLPIKLYNFYVDGNRIIWQTATELDNDYFTLEISKDGNRWENLYQCKGKRYSINLLTYYYDDIERESTVYYRLKQTDYDGTSTYSKIIASNKRRSKIVYYDMYGQETNDLEANTLYVKFVDGVYRGKFYRVGK